MKSTKQRRQLLNVVRKVRNFGPRKASGYAAFVGQSRVWVGDIYVTKQEAEQAMQAFLKCENNLSGF